MAVSLNKRTGKWDFVFDAGKSPLTGKRKQIRRRGFASRAAANDAYIRLKAEVLSENYTN